MKDNRKTGVWAWDSGNNKPAVVWHAYTATNSCAGIYANGWTSTNLPNSSMQFRDHCGYNEEIRVVTSEPNSLSGANYNNYFASSQFLDRIGTAPAAVSFFTIDTYWLNSDSNPTSNGLSGGAGGDGRSSMDKMCFRQNGFSYYRPGGSNYSC